LSNETHLEGQQRVALGRRLRRAEVAADVLRRRRLRRRALRHVLQQRRRQLRELAVLNAGA